MAKKGSLSSDVKNSCEELSEEELYKRLHREGRIAHEKIIREKVVRVMRHNIVMYHITWMFTTSILPKRSCNDFLPLVKVKAPTTQREMVLVVLAHLKAEDKKKFIDRKEDKAVIDVIDFKISQLTKESMNRKKEFAEKKRDNWSAEEVKMDNYEEQARDFFNFLRVLALKMWKRRYLIREDIGRYLVCYRSFERILFRAQARMDYLEPGLHRMITYIKTQIKLLHSAHFFEDKEKSEGLKFHEYLVKFTRRGIVLDTAGIKPDFMNWYQNDRLQYQDEMKRFELGLMFLERAMKKLKLLCNTLSKLAAPDQEDPKKRTSQLHEEVSEHKATQTAT